MISNYEKYKYVNSLNKMAVDMCVMDMCAGNGKTLIFTKKDDFIPTIDTACKHRNFIFFTESKAFTEIIEENFENFACFIFVNQKLNNFEKQYFEQLKNKLHKRILFI